MGISRYLFTYGEAAPFRAKLLYITYSKYQHDWYSLPHTHPFTELCFILHGKGSYLFEGQPYPVQKDDFIIVNSNVSHTETSDGDVPLEYIILGVEGLDFSLRGNREHIIFNCKEDHTDFSFLMNTLLSEMETKKPNYELICQNLLEVLIVRLTRRRASLAFEAIPTVLSNRECLKLKQYMDTNYNRNITLDTLAEISHLNKYYLAHAFTKRFGDSPMNYLCSVRIKASKELLSSTDHSITEVAHSSGFSSQSYFAQCFQKHCGMTASAYRKSCREQKGK